MDVAKGTYPFMIDVGTPNRVQKVALRVTWDAGSPQEGNKSLDAMMNSPESRVPDGGWTRTDTDVEDLELGEVFSLLERLFWL